MYISSNEGRMKNSFLLLGVGSWRTLNSSSLNPGDNNQISSSAECIRNQIRAQVVLMQFTREAQRWVPYFQCSDFLQICVNSNRVCSPRTRGRHGDQSRRSRSWGARFQAPNPFRILSDSSEVRRRRTPGSSSLRVKNSRDVVLGKIRKHVTENVSFL